jgi:phage tail sheath protein FI
MEVDSGPRPIEQVGTAVAAFVGFAPAGPANRPELVTSWLEYVDKFSSEDARGRKNPYLDGAYLPHAVYGYFANGGGICYVVRVLPDDGAAAGGQPALDIPSRTAGKKAFTLTAKAHPLDEAIKVEIEPPTAIPPDPDATTAGGAAPAPAPPPDGAFTLRITKGDLEPEVYANVTLGRGGRGTRNVLDAVKASQLVEIAEGDTDGTIAQRAPNTDGVALLLLPPVQAGLPAAKTTDFSGDIEERSGVEGLQIHDNVTIVCAPDLMSLYKAGQLDDDGLKDVQLAMIDHCENSPNRMTILDPPPGLKPQQLADWRTKMNYDSRFATMYYPWIKVAGPDGKDIEVPPCGHMAGIWARTDATRGVHKAPANEIVRGSTGAVLQVTKGEQQLLNLEPVQVNCIRSFPGYGLRVWGARTLSSDAQWRYIPVRRLFNMVEESIDRGTRWVVFEPNDEELWASIRRDIGAFLTGVWRSGALFGKTTADAFFVKCDAQLNPPDQRDRGYLVVDIGMAPVKPAEFVVFRFQQYSQNAAT